MDVALVQFIKTTSLCIIIIYFFFYLILPRIISWLIQHRFQCSISIEKIGIPYLSLHGVRIQARNCCVLIERIGFTSSLVNGDASKLLSVIVKSATFISYEGADLLEGNAKTEKAASTEKVTAPSFVSNLVQFLGVHVDELNFWRWNSLDGQRSILVSTTFRNISVDGCKSVGGSSSFACIFVSIENVKTRVCEDLMPEDFDMTKATINYCSDASNGLTLAEMNFNFKLNVLFSPKNSGEFIESFTVDVDNLDISWELKEKSLSLWKISQVKSNNEASRNLDKHSVILKRIQELIFRQFVPKEIKIRIYESQCKIFDLSSALNFDSRMSGFSFASKCFIKSESIYFESQFDIGLLRIEPDSHQCLFIDQFSNHIKADSGEVNVDLDVSNFYVRSFERNLHFAKAKLFTTSILAENPKISLTAILDTIASLYFNFETTELNIKWNSKEFSLDHAIVRFDCVDLKQATAGETIALSLCLKKLATSFPYTGDLCYTPISFKEFNLDLHKKKMKIKTVTTALQWVPLIDSPMTDLIHFLNDQTDKTVHSVSDRKSFGQNLQVTEVEAEDLKITYISDDKLCLNGDLESLHILKNQYSSSVSINNFEVYSSSNYSDCTLNPVFTIPKFIYSSKTKVGATAKQVKFYGETVLCWSPFLHIQISEFYDKIRRIQKMLSHEGEDGTKAEEKSSIAYSFPESFIIVGKLSKCHSVEIIFKKLSIKRDAKSFSWGCSTLQFKFDKLNIGDVENLSVCRSTVTSKLTKMWRDTDKLSLPSNQTWLTEIDKISMTFPHGYKFASAFNEEFVSCIKWMKKLRKKSDESESVLWSDVVFKVLEVRIEVGDDPFEVKLRDNYELLEDEYFENLKRQQLFEAKINELYKTNLMVSTAKIEELKSQLQEKSSTIYINRSKKLYDNHAMRSHLLLFELTDVHVIAMADHSMHGKDKILKIMQNLDSDGLWPMEPMEFSTLWCRAVRFAVNTWRVQLRDFPQPLIDSRNLQFWGKLCAAEAKATKRSKRISEIEIGGPFENDFVERSLNSLKWYYDLYCDIDSLIVAFGPCWEPVIAQCNISLENVFPSSKDPSPLVPFWDKIRLIFHGRLYTAVKTLTQLLHASLNPYNTTEEMQVTWTEAAIAWTNGKVIFEGDLDIYVRTASKYDDCRMLHLPNIRLTFKLNWLCLGDPNDHHSVVPCAPDKLPEYSSNQEHDSYRAFRSQNLNMSVSLEVRHGRNVLGSCPTAVLYGSTLRWFENLKLILSGTTRPTRKGTLFNNTRMRKIPISRHYKKIRLSVSLNRFHVCYWVSFSMQSGIEIISGKFSSSSEHQLNLYSIKDNLIHRPKSDWNISYVNSEVNDLEVWLQSSLQPEIPSNEMNYKKPIEKFFFLSVNKLSYGREALLKSSLPESSECYSKKNGIPQHRLVVHELKGAWTSSNRDVAFALFDSFVKVQQLKKNLSTEALKGFFSKQEGQRTTEFKGKVNEEQQKNRPTEVVTASSAQISRTVGTSPITGIPGQNAAASLLKKLIDEAESHGTAYSEDMTTAPPPQQSLHGVAQSSLDDVILHKWQILLVNCQVLMKGCETSGYVILSASKANIHKREHEPVWKHGTLVPKTSWVGALEGMQYYATVSAGNADALEDNIQWLSVENIEERNNAALSNVPEMVGSGQSVGGVVSETVGASSGDSEVAVQLQRIVSRCKCEFFYTTYGETGIEKIPSGIPDIPPVPRDLELWDEINKPVEAFTLMHHDLNVFTNSLQYAMIMDIVNSLVLYVDPKRKERFEKFQRLRFKLQLESSEAQKKPIQQLQNILRSLMSQVKRLEKEAYCISKQLQEDPKNEALLNQLKALDDQVNESKEQVAVKGEELHMMIMCFKESKLAASQRLLRQRDGTDVEPVRVYEICFKHAQWRLTQTDGQLGIADLIISNFLYTKTAKSDDSIEHLCELGYITVTNLLPNQTYKDVLVPSHIQASMPIDRQRTLRVFCRERPAVNGIAVKEHFEINVAPITIGMTYQFFTTLFKFCFPEKDPEKLDEMDPNGSGDTTSVASMPSSTLDNSSLASSTIASSSIAGFAHKQKKTRIRRKESKFYVSMSEKDDVEKMKERAEKNMLFICVKIPEVPVRVSYKGEKEKNIEDVHDVHLVIPPLEYNNITWTWLDFLVAVRNHSKKVLFSQAIKQKLHIFPKAIWSDLNPSPQEEDKAKMLLGLPNDTKGLIASFFSPTKK